MYNLLGIKKLSPLYDLKIILMTALTVFGKDYKPAKQVYTTVFDRKEPVAAAAKERGTPDE